MNDALRVVSIKDLAGTNGREYVANADNIEAFDLSVNWNVWVYGKRSVGTLARDSTSSCYLVKRLRVEIRKDSDDMTLLLSLIESVKGHHDYIEDNSSGN